MKYLSHDSPLFCLVLTAPPLTKKPRPYTLPPLPLHLPTVKAVGSFKRRIGKKVVEVTISKGMKTSTTPINAWQSIWRLLVQICMAATGGGWGRKDHSSIGSGTKLPHQQ
jgi:hypothetical protein